MWSLVSGQLLVFRVLPFNLYHHDLFGDGNRHVVDTPVGCIQHQDNGCCQKSRSYQVDQKGFYIFRGSLPFRVSTAAELVTKKARTGRAKGGDGGLELGYLSCICITICSTNDNAIGWILMSVVSRMRTFAIARTAEMIRLIKKVVIFLMVVSL